MTSRVRGHLLCRRLPPCQSSCLPTVPAATPNDQLGGSRRLRLSSAKPGNGRQPNHVVPQLARRRPSSGSRLITGPEERDPARRLEVQDRGADVLAGQRQRLLGLRPHLVVERGVVERVGQLGWQTGLRAISAPERPRSRARAPTRRQRIDVRGVSKIRRADRCVQRPDRVAPVLRARPRGHPQQPQPGRVSGLVLRREVRVVVDVRR